MIVTPDGFRVSLTNKKCSPSHIEETQIVCKISFWSKSINLLIEKMGKKQSLSMEEWAQIVTLSNLKFSVHQIAKKMKLSKTAVHNAIMKY